jgi:hypothetical protein
MDFSNRLDDGLKADNPAGECQIFCVNPFFALKRVHPNGP